MAAGFKLAWPLLRGTLHWSIWLSMASIGLAALITDSTGIGVGNSMGGGALLVLATALGIRLRACGELPLGRLLPGFPASGLLAAAIILTGLVGLLAVLFDGASPGSLAGLATASALGLGIGLAVRTGWLQYLYLFPVLLILLSGRDLHSLWTGTGAPALALLVLAIGGLRLLWTTQPGRKIQRPASVAYSADPGMGRLQPYRFGHLLSPGPAMGNLVAVALVGFFFGVVRPGGGLTDPPDPLAESALVGYLALGAMMGLIAMMSDLLGRGRQALRSLAVMPGWERRRLFEHAERSCYRICAWLLPCLLVGLMAVAVWAEQPRWSGMLLALLMCSVAASLIIPFGLWVATLPGLAVRLIAFLLGCLPVVLILVMVSFQGLDGSPEQGSAGLLLALGAAAALAWWLRRQARYAWASISFKREV